MSNQSGQLTANIARNLNIDSQLSNITISDPPIPISTKPVQSILVPRSTYELFGYNISKNIVYVIIGIVIVIITYMVWQWWDNEEEESDDEPSDDKEDIQNPNEPQNEPNDYVPVYKPENQ